MKSAAAAQNRFAPPRPQVDDQPVAGGPPGLIDPLLVFGDSRHCLHDDIGYTRVVTAASSVDATLRGDAKYAGANLRAIAF